MYKTLTKRDFLKKLRIDDSETPDGILLYGTWRMKFNQELVKSFLKEVRQVDEHIVLGKFRGKNIMFAVTYGAPYLVDNLIEKHNVLMLTDEDKNNILPVKELILKKGLETISHFCK